MTYLLDTNAIIALFKGDGAFLRRLSMQRPSDCAISTLVLHELCYGACKSQRLEANLARIDALQFEVLPFDHNDARRAAEVRAALKEKGTPIGPYDVLIAGQALARSLTVVTRNLAEFGRVPGLRVEYW